MMKLRTGSRFREETGAEMVEFAVVGPVLFFLIFGIIYALLAAAAQVSLTHASAVAIRYASIPTDPIGGVYPAAASVQTKMYSSTPFFNASNCNTSVAGTSAINSPVTLTANCNFPNPAGALLDAISNSLLSGEKDYDSSLQMSATSKARRE